MHDALLDDVANYYSAKIIKHGASAKGVDWNSEQSQELRFEVLSQLFTRAEEFSILDYGCGYGALFSYLKKKRHHFTYTGFDISKTMLQHAQEINGAEKNANWIDVLNEQTFDYTIASGIFNVRLEHSDQDWQNYVEQTLIEINNKSKKGFAFNMLTIYSDKEYMKQNLYYANPLYYFDYCKKKFSKYVTLLHDYPLYEFTITVKREL